MEWIELFDGWYAQLEDDEACIAHIGYKPSREEGGHLGVWVECRECPDNIRKLAVAMIVMPKPEQRPQRRGCGS
jgi:hypothetical protein